MVNILVQKINIFVFLLQTIKIFKDGTDGCSLLNSINLAFKDSNGKQF